MKKILLSLLLLVISTGMSFGQYSERNSINISAGTGKLNAKLISGNGESFGLGFQRSYFNSRLRLHPNINYGNYSQWAMHFDASVRSLDLRFDINVDMLRFKTVSLFLGGGMYVRNIKGSIRTLDNKKHDINTSQYGGVTLSLGFRVDSSSGKFAIELVPVSLCGLNSYSSFTSLLRIVYKL